MFFFALVSRAFRDMRNFSFFVLVFSYAIQSLSTYNVLHSADRFLSFPYAARLRGGWFFEP